MFDDEETLVELRALVGYRDALQDLPWCCPAVRIVPLEQGLAMVPLPARESARGSANAWGSRSRSSRLGFRWVTPAAHRAVVRASHRAPIGYLEVEYTLRTVWEAAAIWAEGALVYGPRCAGPLRTGPVGGPTPVNTALQRLGVLADEVPDETLAAGLDRHRSTADWYASAAPAGRER